MRAKEFIVETAPDGKIKDEHEVAHTGMWRMRDVGGYDRTYHLNRIMMAMAMADGKSRSQIQGMDASSWVEKFNIAHPYTPQEHNMVAAAMATIPSDGEQLSDDLMSHETPDVNKVSPLPKKKKNRYGV